MRSNALPKPKAPTHVASIADRCPAAEARLIFLPLIFRLNKNPKMT
jgi:hypothetical protein